MAQLILQNSQSQATVPSTLPAAMAAPLRSGARCSQLSVRCTCTNFPSFALLTSLHCLTFVSLFSLRSHHKRPTRLEDIFSQRRRRRSSLRTKAMPRPQAAWRYTAQA
jgi:hypothetical protein